MRKYEKLRSNVALLIVVPCPVIASIAGGEGKLNYAVGVYRAEKKPLYYVLLSKSQAGPGRIFSQPHTKTFSQLCT